MNYQGYLRMNYLFESSTELKHWLAITMRIYKSMFSTHKQINKTISSTNITTMIMIIYFEMLIFILDSYIFVFRLSNCENSY